MLLLLLVLLNCFWVSFAVEISPTPSGQNLVQYQFFSTHETTQQNHRVNLLILIIFVRSTGVAPEVSNVGLW